MTRADEYNWLESDIVSIATDLLSEPLWTLFRSRPLLGPRRAVHDPFDESNPRRFLRLRAEDGVASFFDSTVTGSPFVMTKTRCLLAEARTAPA